jgi:hypothetical protein
MIAQKEKRKTNISGKPKSTPETLNNDKMGKLIKIIASMTTKTRNSRLFCFMENLFFFCLCRKPVQA